jgi:hypothetical protein
LVGGFDWVYILVGLDRVYIEVGLDREYIRGYMHAFTTMYPLSNHP